MKALVERFRVPLAWGLLGSLVLVAAIVTFVPLANAHRDLDARIGRGYETVAKLRAIAASVDETRDRAKRMSQEDVARFVFTGARDGDDLSLQLRKLVDGSAARTGVQLTSVDNIGFQAEAGAGRAGVMIRAQGDVEGIAELLRDIEDHRPLLVIEQLEMRPGRTRRGRAQQTADQSVMMTMRVYGFYLEPSA